MNDTKIAVSHKKALYILADCGVLNELNGQTIYDRLCAEVKQPSQGYFYVDDVYNFGEVLVREALQ